MNYATKKQTVIFELPLSGYLGSRETYIYNKETKRREKTGTKSINSVQEKEEEIFSNFNSNWEYITADDIREHKDEAIKYLLTLPAAYTKEEVEEQTEMLDDNIKRALADAFDSNYQDEWLTKYFKVTQENIEENIFNYLDKDFKMLDCLNDQEFKRNKTDQEFLRVEVSKTKIKEYLKSEKLEIDADYIETFIENVFDYISAAEINIESIDYYGTMGDYKDWLNCFSSDEETSAAIDNKRKDEADKINNAERASLELKAGLNEIDRYAAKYFTKEETRQKIARQVTALKSVIKNAV